MSAVLSASPAQPAGSPHPAGDDGKFRRGVGKYRQLLILFGVFGALVFSLLALNFYASFRSAQVNTAYQLANRQHENLQRIARALLELDAMRVAGAAWKAETLAELRTAANAFQVSQATLRGGGIAPGADGKPITLEAVASPRGRDLEDRIDALWKPWSIRIAPLLRDDFTSAQLAEALAWSQANHIALLSTAGDLAVETQLDGVAQAAELRRLQTGGVVAALVLFVLILLTFLQRLRVAQETGDLAREELREILVNVREGLVMVMPDYRLGARMSRSAHGMFGRTLHADDDFFSQLSHLVGEKLRHDARDYVKLLFTAHVQDSQLTGQNPLHAIEVTARTRGGYTARRHLSFAFHRIFIDGVVNHLLVTIQDTTARMELERKLQDERQRSQKDFSMLLKAFDADPAMLRQFVQRAEACLLEVNDLLGSVSSVNGEAAMSRMLDRAVRRTHELMRDASQLGLESFSTQAQQFEAELQRIQLSGADLATREVDIQNLPMPLQDLLTKVAAIKSLTSSQRVMAAAAPAESLNDTLAAVVQEAAAASNKQVDAIIRMGSHSDLEGESRHLVREIAIQLARNAVAHGIETPPVRDSAGKGARGVVDIQLTRGETDWVLSVRDDGAGVTASVIKQRLIELGWYSAPQLESFDERQIVGHIFKPGFSTADAGSATVHAGRGVGLDVVQANVQRLGGRMTLSSQPGISTEFRIRFAA
ncbi:MAG: chemotaxis protein CheA [Comamonadaceae bacterium]|nr:MAG: chemotaxis protein CheA [Comamonadaceae bacterium]